MAIKRRKGSSDSSQLAVIEPSLDIQRDASLLGDVLSSRGEVTPEAIEMAMLEKNGVPIGEHLIAKGLATEDAVAWALAHQHGLPFIDLTQEVPEPDAPYWVKGVGEPPTVVSTAAIVSALRDATGRELTRVPVRPDDIVGLED